MQFRHLKPLSLQEPLKGEALALFFDFHSPARLQPKREACGSAPTTTRNEHQGRLICRAQAPTESGQRDMGVCKGSGRKNVPILHWCLFHFETDPNICWNTGDQPARSVCARSYRVDVPSCVRLLIPRVHARLHCAHPCPCMPIVTRKMLIF